MLNLATGHYMNYYSSLGASFLGSKQMFIIINEPNGDATEPLDVEKLHKAEEICEKYVDDAFKNKNVLIELEKKLENIFEFGVQMYIV